MVYKIFSGKTFLLITGASQGIGKQIALSIGKNLDNGSVMLLLARNINNLKSTAESLPKNIQAKIHGVDLSLANEKVLKEIIENAIEDFNVKEFKQAVVVHNAGSVGNVTQATIDMKDFEYWRSYYDLNVFSPAVLNGVFMEIFDFKDIKKHVINITSLCGIKPMKSVGYYCSGKAAREMFFKVFAEENPDVNVLNYSPGPVDTDMLNTISKDVGDKETKSAFNEMKTTGAILTTEQTVNRMIEVIFQKKYKSGDHIDYFDEL